MSKRRLVIALLLGSPVLSLASYTGWSWYQTPRVELSSELGAASAQPFAAESQELTFWSPIRHASYLRLSDEFLLQADGQSIPIRLTSLSYPSLYPTQVRVGFELADPADYSLLLKQKHFVLRQTD